MPLSSALDDVNDVSDVDDDDAFVSNSLLSFASIEYCQSNKQNRPAHLSFKLTIVVLNEVERRVDASPLKKR